MAVNIDQQFVEYIVKSIVGNPDDVKIDRRIDEKGVLLELTVNPEDLGRVIGKRGATAQSLRTLLRALGTKNDARYNLKIVDVGGPRPAPVRDDAPAKDDPSSDDAPVAEPAVADEPVVEAPELADNDNSQAGDSDDESHSSVISRTRAELADLDDLDV